MSQSERILNEIERDIRLVASGRLHELENKMNGFKTTQNANDTTKAYRTRSRTLWNNRNKPTQSRYSCQENQEYQQALQIIADANIRGNDPCSLLHRNEAKGRGNRLSARSGSPSYTVHEVQSGNPLV